MRQGLSPIELSFWYQYKFDPSSDANNIIHRLVITRSLDKSTLKDVFSQLLSKHPALRSNFHEEDGLPFRIVNQALNFSLIDGGKMEAKTILEQIRHPFVLEQDSLLRIIFVSHKNTTTLFIACPHIVFDAMSWSIFLDDFTDALNGKSIGAAYTLKYASPEPQAQQYWKQKLNEIEGRVSFEQGTAPGVNEGTLGILEDSDASSVLEKLITFGKSERLSMNSLCTAILAVTLYKMTSSERMIVATPVTMRNEDSADHIGSYINVLPVVMAVDGNKSFLQFAKEASSQIWDDIDNRNFSLIELLSSLSPKYHNDSQGIYNVMAEYVPSTSSSKLVSEDKIVPNKFVKQDFILSVISEADGHRISVEYDASKLEPSYIAQIVKAFLAIAGSILEDPGQAIKRIAVVSSDEARELLEIGSGPAKEIKPPFIWNRFKAVMKEHSDRTAIIENDKKISYKELFDMSCRYAGLLSEAGVAEDTVVGIHMDRSADYIASMLAIWSLGAVYVPLDTKQPASRLEFMIEQAGVAVVMTKGENNLKSKVIQCDIKDTRPVKLRDSDYEPDGKDLAYIIFTSGSTGTPKGVMIEHRGFLNHLEIMIADLKLNQEDVIAQTAPVSFDISVWQLVCAFMVGASVRLVGHDDLIDPDRIYKIVADDSITVLEVVPSLLSGYLTAEDMNDNLHGALKNVKVITTGEAISGSVVKQWISHYPDLPLLNAYGPAEASDDTHFFDILPDSIGSARSIPIGRPLLNIQTYIVDQDLQLCPKGVIGEICIGGIAVAKGYIGNEELTAKSFLPDPFMPAQGTRLYRTGDYGRWRDDNLLEYHGRRDHQVKVRGQRLELGEVEDRLKEVTGVKDAAVIAEKAPSGTRLIGYVVPESNEVSVDDIRAQLRRALPDYMVPWKLELIPDLPRSGNGKLDRKALETYPNSPSLVRQTVKENSELLSEVIRVYSEVLNTQVEADSNYFDCGGDSLQSMKIVALFEKRGIRVGIRDILMYQTPRELAENINTQSAGKISATEEWPALEGFTPIQKYYLETSGKDYVDNGEIQAAVVAIKGETQLNKDALLVALNQIISAHEELNPTKESHALVVDTPKDYSVDELVRSIRPKVSLNTPLVGCVLSSGDRSKVLLVAHHFVLDFYSWTLIQEELNNIHSKKQVIPVENILKRWWGKALEDLTSNTQRLNEAEEFWQQVHGNSQSDKDVKVAADGTKSFTFTYLFPQASTVEFARSGIPMESFVYYITAKAQMAINKQSAFVCNIESSLRSLDDTGALSKGAGWMTYLFPLITEKNTSLSEFCKATAEITKKGYEYGLLRYNILSERFKGVPDPLWTINYIGKSMKGSDDIEVLKELPKKEKSFIEVDISLDGSQLIFEFCHNTTLPKTYFDSIHKELGTIIEEAASKSRTSTSKIEISTKRKDAILKRLKNAG